MKTDDVLTTFENWTLRIRPGKGKRILLLVHGWTGDENSMTIFSRNLPPEFWIISPRAPFKAMPQGFSWRAPAPQGTWPTLELFRSSVDALIDLVGKLADANGIESSVFDAGGFSQGGALCCALGVLYPHRLRKLGILSGFAPGGVEQILIPGMLQGMRIFMAHGTLDEMVPLDMAHHTRNMLINAGADVTYCESQIGHKLSADCLKSFKTFLEH